MFKNIMQNINIKKKGCWSKALLFLLCLIIVIVVGLVVIFRGLNTPLTEDEQKFCNLLQLEYNNTNLTSQISNDDINSFMTKINSAVHSPNTTNLFDDNNLKMDYFTSSSLFFDNDLVLRGKDCGILLNNYLQSYQDINAGDFSDIAKYISINRFVLNTDTQYYNYKIVAKINTVNLKQSYLATRYKFSNFNLPSEIYITIDMRYDYTTISENRYFGSLKINQLNENDNTFALDFMAQRIGMSYDNFISYIQELPMELLLSQKGKWGCLMLCGDNEIILKK